MQNKFFFSSFLINKIGDIFDTINKSSLALWGAHMCLYLYGKLTPLSFSAIEL